MTPVEIMAKMETDLLVSITSHLAKGNIGSAEWQANRLSAFGRVNKELSMTIAKGTEAAIKEATALLEREGVSAAARVDSLVPASYAAALPIEASGQLNTVYAVWDKVLINQFNQVGATMLSSANTAYVDIIEKTTAEVLAGSKTGRAAMAETSRAWSKTGLPALIDKAGRQWTTEAYSQTLVRSNVRNVATGIQEQRLDQYGIDLVEISSHVGARKGCAPFQGKIFSRSGNSKQYPPLSSTTMGEPDGLFGINCEHELFPFIPGTERTNKPVPKKENDEAYKNSQKQRAIERQIRRAKRSEAVAKAAGDTVGAKNAREGVLRGQSTMRQFIDKTGRTRRSSREQI